MGAQRNIALEQEQTSKEQAHLGLNTSRQIIAQTSTSEEENMEENTASAAASQPTKTHQEQDANQKTAGKRTHGQAYLEPDTLGRILAKRWTETQK